MGMTDLKVSYRRRDKWRFQAVSRDRVLSTEMYLRKNMIVGEGSYEGY